MSTPRKSTLLTGLVGAVGLALVLVAAALATHYTYRDSSDINAGEEGGATVRCPAGWRAHWGGFQAAFGADEGAEPTAFKVEGNGWRLLATNSGGEARGIAIEAYCQPYRRALTQRSAAATVAPRGTGAATARCRSGETLLAGGFRGSIVPGGPHVVVDGMRRVGVRNLRVTGANLSSNAAGRVTAYAYCGHGQRPIVASNTVAVPPASAARFVAVCPGHRGELTDLFSGFQASTSDPARGLVVSPAQFRYGGKEKVIVTAVNRSPTEPVEMTAFVYCR